MAADSQLDPQLMQAAATFLSSARSVIADTNGASRAGVAKTLTEMGMKTSQLTLVGDYALAADCIRDMRPNVIVTDYALGSKSGIDLCLLLREAGISAQDSLFVVVTGNASQSAVAQAAEEEVDAYILKPYTLTQFRKVVATAAAGKLKPTQYMRKIGDGKRLLTDKQPEEALQRFQEATRLNEKPSLAYYYKGVAEQQLDKKEEARKSFEQGLSYNDIHYKCLTGLFELLLDTKKHAEAYEVVRKLSKHFPLSPKRLSQVLKLAVVTAHFGDVVELYELFKQMDSRGDELNRHLCAALIVSARAFFRGGDNAKGLDLANKAAVTAGGGMLGFLCDITRLLVEYKQEPEAEKVLSRFPMSDRAGREYLIAKVVYDDAVTTDDRMMIHYARSAIDQGLKDPVAYTIIIKRYIALGKEDMAAEWQAKALELWPDLKARFEFA